MVVPATVDGPHLIFRGDYFVAPIRNHADTEWMKERQFEAMYRARFDERRRSNEAIDALYAEAATGRDTADRAWLIAVAYPRLPGTLMRPTRDEARAMLAGAVGISLSDSDRNVHPLESVSHSNPPPRPAPLGAPATATSEGSPWREAWVSLHHDGSVTVAAVVGGHRRNLEQQHEGWEVRSHALESTAADFTALVRASAAALHHGAYDVCIGVEWTGEQALTVLTLDNFGEEFNGVSTPLHTYTRVRYTLDAAATDEKFHRQVFELAQDCVNQGGITNLHIIKAPTESAES